MSKEMVDRLLAECSQISDNALRAEVHQIIRAAEENADEYVAEDDDADDDGADGWEDAFLGTVENRCTDAPAAVRQWFDANL